jgi:hypothetical protein
MKLLNTLTPKAYPMQKLGPYTGFHAELEVDKRVAKVEWTCSALVKEAVLLGLPKVEVLKASNSGRKLLEDATLSIKIDTEPVYGPFPLLATHLPVPPLRNPCWFIGIEDDVDRGIFISNGYTIQVVVECPRAIEDFPKIGITLEAELYQTIKG